MRKAVTVLLFVASPLFAANHIIDQKTFDAIAVEYSGERAQENDRRIVQYHRIQASPMMREVAERVVAPALRDAGLDPQIDTYPSDGKLLYKTYISPMSWSIREGELWLEGDAPQRLCRYSDVPMCVSTYSKGGEWSGELVDVGSGTSDSDYEGKDVRGKVALASGYAADVVRFAVLKRGAVGTVIYPAANDRPDHPDMVRYNGVWTRADELPRTSGSFQISANQYAQIKSLMAKGLVRVRGRIDATLGPGAHAGPRADPRNGIVRRGSDRLRSPRSPEVERQRQCQRIGGDDRDRPNAADFDRFGQALASAQDDSSDVGPGVFRHDCLSDDAS